MNDPITRPLPPVNTGTLLQDVEQRSMQQQKVAAVNETGRVRGNDDLPAGRKDAADDVSALAERLDRMNMQLQDMQRSLRFSVDDSSGRIVVRVIDIETKEVIRQIPSEEMLVLIRNVNESGNYLFNDEA